jgi:hypothetical protein
MLGTSLKSVLLATIVTFPFALAQPALANSASVSKLDRVALGTNASGESCVATRTWDDAVIKDSFSESFVINCRSVTASRSLGFIRIIDDRDDILQRVAQVQQCGEAKTVSAGRIGEMIARNCYDDVINAQVLSLEKASGNRRILASSIVSLSGPLTQAVGIFSGKLKLSDSDETNRISADDLQGVPASPVADGTVRAVAKFDADAALANGISLSHSGAHNEGSRLLNDAVSRIDPKANARTKIELLLEVALADSNVDFNESAAARFAEVDTLLTDTTLPNRNFLLKKREVYGALTLLNRRQYVDALSSLDKIIEAPDNTKQPLLDTSVLQALNQSNAKDQIARNASNLPDFGSLTDIVIASQAQWARSVALLALGKTTEAQAALNESRIKYALLKRAPIDQGPILWLGSRISRHQGRLSASVGNWDDALLGFDEAYKNMRLGAASTGGTGQEPAIAEVLLERGNVLLRSGASSAAIKKQYSEAIDAVIASGTTSSVYPAGLGKYLQIMVDENSAKGANNEQIFRTLQALGEPAIARQLKQLQSEVNADAVLSDKIGARADVQRQLTRLRYAIDTATGEERGLLETERSQAEKSLDGIDSYLASDARYQTVSDAPATIEEIQAGLQPGEVFFKISEINNQTFGFAITKKESMAYAVTAPQDVINKLADLIRYSIDGKLNEKQIIPFDVAAAHTLFQILTGPARDMILQSSSIVVDPSGPLKNLPVGVLVTDLSGLENNEELLINALKDFSKIAFLSRSKAITSAVSPRSFLVSRALPSSLAPQEFLGFAEQIQPVKTGGLGNVEVGPACDVPLEKLFEFAQKLKPISRNEIAIAANALGIAANPVEGAEFTDSKIMQRGDLDQYKVLHFAAHGVGEGAWGCKRSPPALVTTFDDANSDGLLSFNEIARLKLNANLVVLSACDTASGIRSEALARETGQEASGASLEGLVRAFLTARSRAVLATYWSVSAEKDSEIFIEELYKNARNKSISGALQSAQKGLMDIPKYSHPYYWGAYFVVGDGSKSMLAKTGS